MIRTAPFLNIRRLRLVTGLVLFTYVLTHFLNHAAGLMSLAALEDVRLWFLWLWRNPVMTILLYGSLVIHFLLALWAVYQRRRLLRMPLAEALQLILGLMIVPLLGQHVLGTRLAAELYNVTDSYVYVLLSLWYADPGNGIRQAIALVVAWIHGCLGLFFWLRLRPVYAQLQPVLYAGALLVPVVGLLGFWVAGRDIVELARDPVWLQVALADIEPPTDAEIARLESIRRLINAAFAGAVAIALLARVVRGLVERQRGLVRLTYPGGREVTIVPGMSVLEASQLAGIPHASVCGGRGRCSTCRVRVDRALDTLPPPTAQERTVLARVSAPPNVRLACQIRPRADLAVTPLLPANVGPAAAYGRPAHTQGQEQEIAIMFADLRNFTALAEGRLPYDVVFVLNRYFAAIGQAIERAGGRVDKFIGDGVMALFGIDAGPANGARAALAAARAMGEVMGELNTALRHDLDRPLRIGIGIHVGPAIIGEMGYARATSLTAIGDAVNTASRIEALTKDYSAELVVSEQVAVAAGVDLSAFPTHMVEVRGRREPLMVRVLARAADVPAPAQMAPRGSGASSAAGQT
ncbi:MAG TPA: adenylate/guanylate cyclase domain-containing protein [Alphaproteobacteria bacterium]